MVPRPCCANCAHREEDRCDCAESAYSGKVIKAWNSCPAYEEMPIVEFDAAWQPRDLMPTPNGAAFRIMFGKEPGRPITLEEAKRNIGRCIKEGREKVEKERGGTE